MATTTITVLQPDFYKDFGCVAAACRNSCCVHRWKITADKKNYKKLRNLKQPLWLAQNLSQYISRNPDSIGDSDYATLSYNQNGCAMQTAEGLCRLQSELGADYLCRTCRIYPRGHILWMGQPGGQMVWEKALCSSCEEVARILLHKPEPIQFVTHEQDVPAEPSSSYYRDVTRFISPVQRPELSHYHMVRSICIAVLQDREHSFAQRMKLLCVLLDKLNTAVQGHRDSIPQLLESFVSAVESGIYDPLLQGGGKTDMAAVFACHGSLGAFSWGEDARFAEMCTAGLQSSEEGRAALYEAYMQDKQHLLEHIFVSELFTKGLPFLVGSSIWDGAQYMVASYIVLRYVMGAWLEGKGDTPTEVELIDFVALYGKTVLHSDGNVKVNLKLLELNKMQSLAHMITLING